MTDNLLIEMLTHAARQDRSDPGTGWDPYVLCAEAATALTRLQAELEEVKGRREGDPWPLEIRDALSELEERYDIELVSLDHHAMWVRRCEAAEARATQAEQALEEVKGSARDLAPQPEPLTVPDAAVNAETLDHLDPSRWEVEVRVDGTGVLTIGSHGYLAGYSEIDHFGDAVRAAGQHLLAFIGTGEPTPCFACDGSDQERWMGACGEEVGPCTVCGENPEDVELPI